MTAGSAQAVPQLQLDLDADDAFYSGDAETIQTTSDTFSVYLYLSPLSNANETALLADTYYISIALTPQRAAPGMLGSFDVNGGEVRVTQDMTYGRPPLELALDGTSPSDPGDLAPHGIFDTFFYEVAVQFSAGAQTAVYNTQDVRFADGFDSTVDCSSVDCMYFVKIDIDKSDLSDAVQLHFDGYNTSTRNGDIDITKGNDPGFVPFSHDAETVVPEPTGLLLFSAGLLLVGRTLRRQR
ncbi:MAG: choice-of-anchor N protein [Myxococcales bacterium]|nr:choice-of-anchor N protein [Myxococcales bacterium]